MVFGQKFDTGKKGYVTMQKLISRGAELHRFQLHDTFQ